MAGERLHEFSLALCDYLLGQIRPHLPVLAERPRVVPKLDYTRWHELDMSTWLGRAVAALPALLAEHIWAGVGGEKVVLPLNDTELNALAIAVSDPPQRCEEECIWVRYPAFHRQSVECVTEITSVLTKQSAEEWAVDSAGFAARLSEEGLPLADGVDTVHEWLWCARRLLGAMGATECLPAAFGTHPTPTRPSKDHTTVVRTRRRRGCEVDRAENSQPSPEMLSPARISKRFSVSRSTVYSACRSGQLPHYRVPATKGARGKYLFREGDVLAWLETHKVATGSPTPSVSVPASSGSRGGLFSELGPKRLERAWKG